MCLVCVWLFHVAVTADVWLGDAFSSEQRTSIPNPFLTFNLGRLTEPL